MHSFFLFSHFRVVSLCMSPVNDSFMSGSLDHSVRIWDLRVNACQVGQINPQQDSVNLIIIAIKFA